ncbi:hypothetical protein BH10ACI3_BH10ACI3_21210 [soil metagenome]
MLIRYTTQRFALNFALVAFLLACVLAGRDSAGRANAETEHSASMYTWQQPTTGDWQSPLSWSPARTTPAANDVLIFNAGGTPTVVNVPTQTIGQLIVSGNTAVNLQSASDIVLTIAGGNGDDLVIPFNSALNFNGANSIVTALATGSTGAIEGAMTFSSSGTTAHRLTAVDVGAITLKGSAVFTAGSGFIGNPFGTTHLNSVIFESGSTYVCVAGGDPFGAPEPDSVVVFKHGSLFSLQGNVTPSFSGRTYANFEVNSADGQFVANGSSALIMDDLTLTAGRLALNLSGNPGHSIKGNIEISAGGILSLGSGTIRLDGPATQTISGVGPQSVSGSVTLAIDNPAGIIILSRYLFTWNLQLINGIVSVTDPTWYISAGGTVTRTNGYVKGVIQRFMMGTGTYVFDVGTENGYSPVTVNLTHINNGSGASILYVRALETAEPNIFNPSKALSRYWELVQADDMTADLTFHYLDPTDIPATANESNFVVQKYTDGVFTQPAGVVDPVANTFRVLGVTHFNRDWTLAEPGAVGTPTPTNTPTATPTNTQTATPTASPTPLVRTEFDYDGDGRSDVSVYRPSNGLWYLQRSTAGETATQFGISTDKIAPADFDGDGKTDVAVYRQASGTWYIYNSATATYTTTGFGIAEDLPAPGDYDGDGKADIAIYRPSTGTWWLNRSTAGLTAVQFGLAGDVPVPGDYDGDGKADLVVYRPSNGVWYMQRSTAGGYAIQFGNSTDKIVPADYDGDGKMDVAVYRPSQGTWYSVNSSNGAYPVQVFGLSDDIPVPGDYDGDGKADVGIFRPSNGQWWLNRTTSGLTVTQFGSNGDKPTESAFGN